MEPERKYITTTTDNMLAAVDLGSNSFHMIVARLADDGSLQIIDKLKEMVRLGAGLDEKNKLSKAARQTALDCLQRFGQRLQDIDPDNVRIVGTNTLRKAKNAAKFLKEAQKYTGQPIDIISGIEEARLIFLGVSHTVAAENDKKRLVIDIGGGSTEIIIGKRFTPVMMESLYMGSVNMTRKFFSDGGITVKQLRNADIYARRMLEQVSYSFMKTGWKEVIGTSGSIRAIASVIQEEGLGDAGINLKALRALRQRLLDAARIDNINLRGLTAERRPVFIGGFVVLYAIVRSLNIDHIEISDGALREGLLYDLLGRIRHEDVRETTIQRMLERYSIQNDHATNIATTANQFLNKLAKTWNISRNKYESLLRWAALLHEIGLTVAHAGYHKHGAYLAKNSDMPGFSFSDQLLLATLIHTHRQKFDLALFDELPDKCTDPMIKLAIILRLAIILHRSRTGISLPELELEADEHSLHIHFPSGWFKKHTLMYADLQSEKKLLAKSGFKLSLK